MFPVASLSSMNLGRHQASRPARRDRATASASSRASLTDPAQGVVALACARVSKDAKGERRAVDGLHLFTYFLCKVQISMVITHSSKSHGLTISRNNSERHL